MGTWEHSAPILNWESLDYLQFSYGKIWNFQASWVQVKHILLYTNFQKWDILNFTTNHCGSGLFLLTESEENAEVYKRKYDLLYVYIYMYTCTTFLFHLVYVVIALFCLAGASGLYYCLLPLWKKIIPLDTRLVSESEWVSESMSEWVSVCEWVCQWVSESELVSEYGVEWVSECGVEWVSVGFVADKWVSWHVRDREWMRDCVSEQRDFAANCCKIPESTG